MILNMEQNIMENICIVNANQLTVTTLIMNVVSKLFCNYKFLISSWLHCVQCIVRILYSTSTDHVYNRSIENER
ncbi:hypothetical protein T05_16028 [Trichinella murrelli]|uniref:Uncharacterized protein n=1 Tax=Trichinella murrelli TaxID=144512 RepID=A0A0V0TZE9_9BILA|nr:hypothetical protein T05_16028 [Trichinella murrelli]